MKLLSICLGIFVSAVSVLGYSVDIDDSEIEFGKTTLPGLGEYDYVIIPDGVMIPAEPGSPSLPGYSVMVALPTGTLIESVEVTYAEPVTIEGTYNIIPTQGPLPIGEKPDYYASPDKTVYSSSAPFPGEIVSGFNSGNMSGYHVGTILFAPVQYVPATGELIVYRRIEFDLVLAGATDTVYPKIRLDWTDRFIRDDLAANVINPFEIPATSVANPVGGKGNVYPYLIITPTEYEDEVEPLVEWKTKKGYPVAVVTDDDITSGYNGVDFEEKVRECIKDYYENYGTVYVCLVGDKDDIGMRYAYDSSYEVSEGDHKVPTDNYYGCLDGDWNADGDNYWGEHPSDNVDYYYDVYVGRLQASSAGNVSDIVEKIMTYEGTELAAVVNPYDYQDEVCLAGAWLDSNTNTAVMMEYIDDNYLIGSFWNINELYDSSYYGTNFNATAFIAKMNAGMNVIAHSAHSNTTVLGANSGSVSSTDLYNLDNSPRYTGAFYSLGCYQGNYDSAYNCPAKFVAAPNGGGVGYVGNTRYGWYASGYPLHYYSAVYEEEYFKQLGYNDVYIGGATNVEHKHANNGLMNEDIYRYINFELYHTGDPGLWVYTDTIGTLNVDYVPVVTFGSQQYDVTVSSSAKGPVEDALVCLWKGDEVYCSGLTDSSGEVSFTINPSTEGVMYLTATSHNNRTFEADVAVDDGIAIDVVYFEGTRSKEGVNLDWEVSDPDGYSFNIHRRVVETESAFSTRENAMSPLSGWTKINSTPIKGGNPYTYLDTTADAVDYEYRLDAVKDGNSEEAANTMVTGDLPFVFSLKQSYPNPSNGAAIIAFSVPRTMNVNLEVFDVKGRKVATLIDETLNEGEYETAISDLSPGIYLYRMQAGEFNAVKKMVAK